MQRSIRIGVLLAVLLTMSLPLRAQQPTAQEPYLQTCLRAAADLSPIHPTDTFPADMRSICAVFRLGSGERYNTLGSSWVAVDVGDVAPPNTEVARFDLHLDGRVAAQFTYSQPGPMPPGKYRLDVTADGKPWKSAEFTVLTREQTPVIPMEKVRDLFPVSEGKTWVYDFVQEGINVYIPGIEPDAEGKLRATVTMTVGAVEPMGIRVRTRRNDQPVVDEWWRVTEGGIFTVRSTQPDGMTVIFQPPLFWLPFPPQTPNIWYYEPRDKEFKHAYLMWGPVMLPSPTGQALGYIVVSEQDVDTLSHVTSIRHYVPGVGMTRETVISAFNDELMRRQEMTLRGDQTGAAGPSTAP